MFVSDNQVDICCYTDDESIHSSSGSTGGQRRRGALDDRDVAAYLDNQHLDAGVERFVVVRLGEQVDVTAARHGHPHLSALRARDRQQQEPFAADQR